jgi:hypothetical protein
MGTNTLSAERKYASITGYTIFSISRRDKYQIALFCSSSDHRKKAITEPVTSMAIPIIINDGIKILSRIIDFIFIIPP